MSSNSASTANQNVVLKPSPRLPLFITIFGLLLFPVPLHPWPSIVISSFGLFLLLQTFTLRLEFTPKDLIVKQLGRELRRFPFQNWLAWRLILPGLPGLLYFREKASPHLLPILFDPKMLEAQLKLRVGSLEASKQTQSPNT